MKKIILTLIILFSLTPFCWAIDLDSANKERLVLDEKAIEQTANQLDFLLKNNDDKALEKKWYVIVLGKDINYIKKYISNAYDYLDVSNSSYNFNKQFLEKINNTLIETNKQNDYASYAIITDSGSKIIIPTTSIHSIKMGAFLDELERRLITVGNENIPLQLEQRDTYKELEKRIKESSDYKSVFISQIVEEIYNKTTKFKNSSKKYKILHYSIITPLNFLNGQTTQGDLTMGDITTVDTQVHGTKYFYSKNEPLNIDGQLVKAFRDTYYKSLTEYQEYEKLMLARVASYQQYIEGKDLDVLGLEEGFGKKVYIAQQQKINNEEEQKSLLKLCNFLSDEFKKQTVSEDYEVIVDINSIESGKDRISLLESIIRNDITTKDALLNLYPYYGIARQYEKGLNEFRVFFSKFNLWTKIGDTASLDTFNDSYNNKSVDFIVSKDRSVKSKYYYSLSDLIVRYKSITSQDYNNVITQEILKTEEEGMAFAIAQKDYHDQYVSKWGTDSAFIFVAYWSAHWAHDLAAAHFARQLAFEYGAFLVEEVVKQLGKEIFKKVVERYGKDALQGALIDYGIQSAFNYILNDEINSFVEAASPTNINWLSVAWSAGENTIPYNRLLFEFGISGTGACLVNGLSEAGGFKDTFDYQSCAVGVAVTYGIKVIFKAGSSPYLRKQAVEALKKGKDRLKKILVKKGVLEEKADEFIEGVQKALDDSEGVSQGEPTSGSSNVWDDIIVKGKKGVKETLEESYKTIDHFLESTKYKNKVSTVDFVKYKGRGGKLELDKYIVKHKVITKNRMKGKIAEETFLDLEKGFRPDFAIQTSDGPRLIDNMLNGTAREIKSGNISVTSAFKRQVKKDLEIIKRQLDDEVIKIEWHALEGIDAAALTFIRNVMTTIGVSADKFKIVVY